MKNYILILIDYFVNTQISDIILNIQISKIPTNKMHNLINMSKINTKKYFYQNY